MRNGAVTDGNTPVPVSFLNEADVDALAAGDTYIVALKCYGAVWA